MARRSDDRSVGRVWVSRSRRMIRARYATGRSCLLDRAREDGLASTGEGGRVPLAKQRQSKSVYGPGPKTCASQRELPHCVARVVARTRT